MKSLGTIEEDRTMKIDWKRKLTSRKFWLALTGLIAGLVVAFRGSAELAETITGTIMSAASVVAYIVGEGLIDAASISEGETEDKDKEE